MKKIICILLALMLLPLAPALAEGQERTIVASFYPIYIMAKNVLEGVEGVRLSVMTAPSTGCLHDYQLLISDMRALSQAEIFLINGAGMEAFLPDVLPQFPDLEVVDCSRGVPLLCNEEAHDHDHGHEEAEEDHHDHDHDHGEYNPHIWLAPKNAIRMVENMASALALALPEAADRIEKNAAAYIARLTALDAELKAAIETLPQRDIVTFHEAFPYFADAYQLHVVAIVALEPESPLSPRMVEQVVEKVRAAGNPPLFAEPQYQSPALTAISQETGAPVFILDSMVTGPDTLTAYEDAMRENLQVLRQALGD